MAANEFCSQAINACTPSRLAAASPPSPVSSSLMPNGNQRFGVLPGGLPPYSAVNALMPTAAVNALMPTMPSASAFDPVATMAALVPVSASAPVMDLSSTPYELPGQQSRSQEAWFLQRSMGSTLEPHLPETSSATGVAPPLDISFPKKEQLDHIDAILDPASLQEFPAPIEQVPEPQGDKPLVGTSPMSVAIRHGTDHNNGGSGKPSIVTIEQQTPGSPIGAPPQTVTVARQNRNGHNEMFIYLDGMEQTDEPKNLLPLASTAIVPNIEAGQNPPTSSLSDLSRNVRRLLPETETYRTNEAAESVENRRTLKSLQDSEIGYSHISALRKLQGFSRYRRTPTNHELTVESKQRARGNTVPQNLSLHQRTIETTGPFSDDNIRGTPSSIKYARNAVSTGHGESV
eukprot:GHVT01077388.1.p1 GENE.GHVT01077388.1~~GHVT01077388.1.p1  ORF type:complete len:403 (+),score=31.75 GHVT01077388.1:602-1810(+)